MPKQTNSQLQVLFGENLRKIRTKKKLSLADVAARCDIDKSNISKIENGHFNIQLNKIFELAKGLDVQPMDLLNFELNKSP